MNPDGLRMRATAHESKLLSKGTRVSLFSRVRMTLEFTSVDVEIADVETLKYSPL